MFKIALVGLGGMGRGHLSQLELLVKNCPNVELVALCDIDPKAFGVVKQTLNLEGLEKSAYDFSKYHLYYDVDEMLANEELDMVDVVVPTYDHSTVACKVMNKGIHCLSEKPMALSLAQCQLMIDTAKKNNVKLMIGQCMRFDNNWMVLKDFFKTGRLGAPIGGYFNRFSVHPVKEWFFCREKSGGALLDFHVHDVDLINYYYGMPKAVSTVGRIVFPGSGYDIISTNYLYDEKYALHSECTWANSDPGFFEGFRADFELGTVTCDAKGFRAFERDGDELDLPVITANSPYYNEIEYFINSIREDTENLINPPESSMNSIKIALAEMQSADLGGQIVEIQ